MRPRLLDLFCGAGGCSVGYHRAGFDVVGVDLHPQPNYPYRFHRVDALEVLRRPALYRGFDAIHASPPCQHYMRGGLATGDHPDLLGKARELLEATGKPWVIENVPGAPMRPDAVLCGSMFGLPIRRALRLHVRPADPPCSAAPCSACRSAGTAGSSCRGARR